MIQATFTAGALSATVHGLHQWDHGRQLQIKAEGLPDAFEVHFECPGMKEAEVRTASPVDGVPTVRIPDRCLKQPAPIKAWVYLVDDTSGRTALEVILPVTPRLKPPETSDPEQDDEAGNKYDQLFALMNEAYDAIEACKNVDANADEAQASADASATSADIASKSAIASSSYAEQAKAHASAAQTYMESCQQYASEIYENSFSATNRSYAEPTTESGMLLYCEGDEGQYYHATLEDTNGTFIDFGLIFWDGVNPMRSTGPFYGVAQALFLDIQPEPSSNDSWGDTTYHAGRASVWVFNVINGDNWALQSTAQTLYITPLTGAKHTPE